MKIERIEDFASAAKELAPRIPTAVVCANDAHTLAAVTRARRDNFIQPLLIGPIIEIETMLADAGEPIDAYVIIDCDSPDKCAAKAMGLVHDGSAGMIIKGLIETSQLMRRALSSDGGIRTGVVSAVSVYEFAKYHKLLAVTDMGINMFPDLERKQAIIENAVGFMRIIGVDCPKVAVLSSTAHASEKQPDTMEAAELKRRNRDGIILNCIVEGPISFDLALIPEMAAAKHYESPVAGDADILIMPDIVAGNIAVKAMGFFGEPAFADAIVGCAVPIVFGSRGGPIEGKYLSIALSALIAAGQRP